MMRRNLTWSAAVLTCILLAMPQLFAQKKKKLEEPLPLPPQLPMVLAANTGALDFHISPLLKTGRLSAQIRESLTDLIRDTRGETIIKLRAFVSGVGDARRVGDQVGSLFKDHKLPYPVLSVLQVGALGSETAQVVIEAVVETRHTVNPNGLVFLGGQDAPTFAIALERLKASASAAGLSPDRMLTCTCFTSRMDDYAQFHSAVAAAFPQTQIDVVQALRSPPDETSRCTGIGQLSAPPKQELVLMEKSHAALVNSQQLVFTGLQLSFGSYLDDAREAFSRLQRSASTLGATAESPVEITAFSLDMYAGSALRKSSHLPPSVFSVEAVEGLPALDASAGIEAVLAPNVASPAVLSQ